MTKPFFAKTARIAAAGAFVAFVAAGSASALTLKYDGTVDNLGFEKIDMTTPTLTNVNTGGFKMKDTSNNNSFAVFCLDLLASIYSGRSYGYEATNTPFTNGGVDLTVVDGGSGLSGIDRIQRIFDSSYDAAFDSLTNSAGFQLALWNAVYDVDWSVGDNSSGANGGTFYQTDTDDEAVRTAANGFLSDAFAYNGGQKYSLTFLQSTGSTQSPGRSQNLVTASPVPLPAAGLMLLAGIGGLFVGRRRKKA